MRYAGVKESILHQTLKQEVADALLADSLRFVDVKTEKVRYSTKDPTLWRRPDVSGTFLNRKMVFEIQLSTTYLNVIAEREAHYRDDQSFIVWLFSSFDRDALKFVHKDILYANHGNAFVFDEAARKLSKDKGKLILHCYQLSKLGGTSGTDWVETFVDLADLTYDTSDYRVYLNPPELRQLATEFGAYWLGRMSLPTVDRMALDDEFILRFGSFALPLELNDLEKLLDALFSLKTGSMVGYHYPSNTNGFLQLSNSFLNSYSRYARLFLWAMSHYGQNEEVKKRDKTGKLKKKVEEIRQSKEKPEFQFPTKYLSLVRLLFPDLPPKAFVSTAI